MKTIPAFPTNAMSHDEFDIGMTLRDYFAAKIMVVLMTDPEDKDVSWVALADTAYLIADAMMIARDNDET